MKPTLFFNDFPFVSYHFGKYRYTDNRGGAAYHYLAVMEEGWCRIAADECEITVHTGEAFYIPMGLSYQSYWFSENHVRFLSYGFTYFPGEIDYQLQKLDGDAYTQIRNIPLGNAPDAAALGKFYTVLGNLIPQMEPVKNSSGDRLVRLAAEYMRKDHCLSIAEIAKRCCVSESTLYAAFRSIGTTPNDKRQQLRIEQAVKLLMTTGNSVQEISDHLEFSSTNYFRRVLKEHTGMSPREIRSRAETV